jgi:hypothetical protein
MKAERYPLVLFWFLAMREVHFLHMLQDHEHASGACVLFDVPWASATLKL